MRAHVGGYFWMPCPLCGRMFGGHEKGGTLMRDMCSGQMTCANSDCMVEAERRNKTIFPRLEETSYIGPGWVD